MALYWPDQKVALEIVDDPDSEPFDPSIGDGWTVIQVTCGQVMDQESMMDGLFDSEVEALPW